MADENTTTPPVEGQRKSKRGRLTKDLSGKIFFRLKVIDRAPDRMSASGQVQVMWNCQCQCGKLAVSFGGNLIKGHTKSCGCLRSENGRKNVGSDHPQFSHGGSRTPEYKSWNAARSRVTDKLDHKYPSYGGRGIGMCQEWIDNYEQFRKDMGPRPLGTTLDRIDNNGWYTASNCRWSSPKDQARNRRSCMVLTIGDQQKTAVEWGEVSGVDGSTIRQRINILGWDAERAVFTPSRQKKKQRIKKEPLL